MRRVAIGLGLALVTVGASGAVASAGNVPPGGLKKGTEPYQCEGIGTVNIIAAGGRVGIDADTGDRYALREITVTDQATDAVLYAKSYGRGPRGESIECTAEFSDPMGDVLVTVQVVPLPSN